jgi:hypothetical protein
MLRIAGGANATGKHQGCRAPRGQHATCASRRCFHGPTTSCFFGSGTARPLLLRDRSRECWSVRELERQVASLLFERLTVNRDQEHRATRLERRQTRRSRVDRSLSTRERRVWRRSARDSENWFQGHPADEVWAGTERGSARLEETCDPACRASIARIRPPGLQSSAPASHWAQAWRAVQAEVEHGKPSGRDSER